MVVNEKKTNILCISDALSFKPRARLSLCGSEMCSGDSLKLLGFTFSGNPTVNTHVEMLIKRLRSRTWALSKLRRAGFSERELVKFYCGAIRPVAEYATPAFHSMIPGYLAAALERQQTQALKNIFGPDLSAREMRKRAGIETLQKRRERATLKFAEKAVKSPRFGRWFPLRSTRATRSTRPYLEIVSRTDRNKNSPVNYMRRALNNARQEALSLIHI